MNEIGTYDVANVVVAVIDTGSPTKGSRAWESSTWTNDEYDFVSGDGDATDPSATMEYPSNGSHGTHVATTIAAKNDGKNSPMYFVNPVIKNKDNLKSTYEEGCLSVPDQFAEIDRPKKCEVEYLDYNGKKKLLRAEGLLATCIQHEMDHLEGILFIDYLSKLKKSMIIKKLSKNKSNRIVV